MLLREKSKFYIYRNIEINILLYDNSKFVRNHYSRIIDNKNSNYVGNDHCYIFV